MFVLSRILVGGILLILGRKLFWFFVAAIGFFVAYDLTLLYMRGQPEILAILIGLGVGLLGALLAIFLRSVAIYLAGFLGGGYFALSILAIFGLANGVFGWIGFILGGIIGGVLVALFFDWALIIISSLGGAAMITQGLRFVGRPIAYLIFLVLLVLGIIIQGAMLGAEKKPT